MMVARWVWFSCLVSGLLVPGVVRAQGLEYVKAHYTKHEFKIRDHSLILYGHCQRANCPTRKRPV